ncbi:MAG: NADH:flavin oxidoreductase [Paenibacillaceae bacterium]|jgi:2,4-dienoyl-CoA reductase-like NADH-dependent reductase (Old Yellow Enzyme family)|nr:NADH:flavin oxidoreductase [Paenibacillaceae bacterium]
MRTLFDQTQFAGLKLKNRFVRSATNDGFADGRGHVTPELMQIYEGLAKGGVGTIITGLTYVSHREQPYPGQMGIYDDSFIEDYKPLTDAVHRYEANIIVQLVSVGTQTRHPENGGKVIWGPSAVEDAAYKNTPKEMTVEDIGFVQQAFAEGAMRAKKAGFDGVQMHVAHGYLLSKFLTPYYNRRTDAYGGSLENRARMITETYQAIREKVGADYPVLVKINSEDFMEQGLTAAECVEVCEWLAELGIDAIEVSGGSSSSRPNEGPARNRMQESYFQSHAAAIAEAVQVPIIAVGGHREFASLTDIVNQTAIEYLALSRPLIRETDLINRWQQGDLARSKCASCNKCFRNDGTRCIFVERNVG